MKARLIIIFLLFLAQHSVSQTELIAYKSHSGNMANFKTDGFDNLGIPPMRIDTIVILNDSTIIEISSIGWSGRPKFCIKDTVVNHPMYKKSEDYEKLRGNYYDKSIVFLNYDTLTVKQKKKLVRQNKRKNKKKNELLLITPNHPNSNLTLYIVISLVIFLTFYLTRYYHKAKISI